MTAVFNKYEVLITSKKCNYMYPEQEQIMALTTVVEQIKGDNIKLSKSAKTDCEKHKAKGNQD